MTSLLLPSPDDPRLTQGVTGIDQDGRPVEAAIVHERPLTLFLNDQEIVTMMTIGDHPDYLALGYLLNQNMLHAHDVVTEVVHDEELELVVVRTERPTDYQEKLARKVRTSGCAQGTVFGDLMERFDEVVLPADAIVRTSWLYSLMREINTIPSLYLKAGAIHGCALCEADRVLVYMEDVGRHNAVDKIAGYMWRHGLQPRGKLFYTTGRLTSEMVIKTVQMGIPVLASRSGFTAWGVDLARRAGLTLIGRARGRRFLALSGAERHRLRRRPAPCRRRGPPARPQGQPRGGRRMSPAASPAVLGLLLAGGQARRMGGGDKCLKQLGGRTLLEHAVERVRPQTAGLLLNANGAAERFAHFGLPVVADDVPGFAGPLAGILAGLEWANRRPGTVAWVASLPTDTPFLPGDLVRRLSDAVGAQGVDLACAASAGRTHPVIGLWPVRLASDLRRALVDEGMRKIDAWTARLKVAVVEFETVPVDPFFNVNTPDDIAAAETLLARIR